MNLLCEFVLFVLFVLLCWWLFYILSLTICSILQRGGRCRYLWFLQSYVHYCTAFRTHITIRLRKSRTVKIAHNILDKLFPNIDSSELGGYPSTPRGSHHHLTCIKKWNSRMGLNSCHIFFLFQAWKIDLYTLSSYYKPRFLSFSRIKWKKDILRTHGANLPNRIRTWLLPLVKIPCLVWMLPICLLTLETPIRRRRMSRKRKNRRYCSIAFNSIFLIGEERRTIDTIGESDFFLVLSLYMDERFLFCKYFTWTTADFFLQNVSTPILYYALCAYAVNYWMTSSRAQRLPCLLGVKPM